MHMNTPLKGLLLALFALSTTAALADPPGRVGRVSYIEGEVDFRDGVNEDAFASINWPVTSQNILSTVAGARAEMRVGSASVRLGSDTELEVQQLDDEHFRLYLSHGSLTVRIKDPDMARQFELVTPQGHVVMNSPARIRVDADRSQRTIDLKVIDGSAHFNGNDTDLTVREHSRIDVADGSLSRLDTRDYGNDDEFDSWVLNRDQRDDSSVSVRYVSPDVTGYEELDNNGSWVQTTDYGPVWYPAVVVTGWAPYRAGHWTWVQPWGWTWVDDARWGYATSHYGRWVTIGGRWCWSPGQRVSHPIWAPAVVGWVGGNNWSLTVSSGPSVGWFPLAPREVYVPTYVVSPTYVQQINVTHVTNVTNITYVNGTPTLAGNVNYRNRLLPGAVTVVPQSSFIPGKPVAVATSAGVTSHQVGRLQTAPTFTPVFTNTQAVGRTNVIPGKFGSITPVAATPINNPSQQAVGQQTPTSYVPPRPMPNSSPVIGNVHNTSPTPVLGNTSTTPQPTNGRVLTAPTVVQPNYGNNNVPANMNGNANNGNGNNANGSATAYARPVDSNVPHGTPVYVPSATASNGESVNAAGNVRPTPGNTYHRTDSTPVERHTPNYSPTYTPGYTPTPAPTPVPQSEPRQSQNYPAPTNSAPSYNQPAYTPPAPAPTPTPVPHSEPRQSQNYPAPTNSAPNYNQPVYTPAAPAPVPHMEPRQNQTYQAPAYTPPPVQTQAPHVEQHQVMPPAPAPAPAPVARPAPRTEPHPEAKNANKDNNSNR